MNTWKLSIKPESKEGFDAFKKCKDDQLLGLGWHHSYVSNQPADLNDAKILVNDLWKKWPHPLKYLLEDMKANDHVWIHQGGNYHLCRPIDDNIIFGSDIDQDFASYDLGHARKAEWVLVPDKFVTGKVQRGTIAPKAVQRIKLTNKEVEFNKFLFCKLRENKNWEPEIDDVELKMSIQQIKFQELFSLMTPDDVEDVVAAYMQNNGWMLIKSTCFRSKPRFEFSMLHRRNGVAHIQVKSGKTPDQLKPEKYKDDASVDNLIYLFSTHSEPYPGESFPHVNIIEQRDLFHWVIDNIWALTAPLKIRLWIYLNEMKFDQSDV
jgi:hypothetical protein